jgi:hypothetical protein
MNKFNEILLAILLFAIIPSITFSQTLSIVGDTVITKIVDIDEFWDIYLTTDVYNSSFAISTIKVKAEVIEMSAGHSYDICWNGQCYAATGANWDDGMPYGIAANSKLGENLFYSHYYATNQNSPTATEGTGKIKYIFYLENNPSDNCSLVATFSFATNSVKEIFANEDVEINFDNDLMSISYPSAEQSTMQIFNIQGQLIDEITFWNTSSYNLNNLQSGSYLIRIINQNKQIATGKFNKI